MSGEYRLTDEHLERLRKHRHDAGPTCIHTADGFRECKEWANYFAPVVESIVSEATAQVRADIAAEIERFKWDEGQSVPHNMGCEGEPDCVACVWNDAARIARGANQEADHE